SRLSREGVGRGTLAGVCMDRSLELVEALLAILLAGGAYVPMDPEYPPERLAHMVEDAAVAGILTDAARALRAPTIALSGASPPANAPSLGHTGEELAYVIYTSGSTGKPKGAMSTHGGLFNRLKWMQEELGLGPDDAVLQKTPFSFDVSVWELFWPLIVGA